MFCCLATVVYFSRWNPFYVCLCVLVRTTHRCSSFYDRTALRNCPIVVYNRQSEQRVRSTETEEEWERESDEKQNGAQKYRAIPDLFFIFLFWLMKTIIVLMVHCVRSVNKPSVCISKADQLSVWSFGLRKIYRIKHKEINGIATICRNNQFDKTMVICIGA